MPKSVRAKADQLTINNRTFAAGEVCEDCPDDRAKDLVARGLAEFVSTEDARDLERTVALQTQGGPVESAIRRTIPPPPVAAPAGEEATKKK